MASVSHSSYACYRRRFSSRLDACHHATSGAMSAERFERQVKQRCSAKRDSSRILDVAASSVSRTRCTQRFLRDPLSTSELLTCTQISISTRHWVGSSGAASSCRKGRPLSMQHKQANRRASSHSCRPAFHCRVVANDPDALTVQEGLAKVSFSHHCHKAFAWIHVRHVRLASVKSAPSRFASSKLDLSASVRKSALAAAFICPPGLVTQCVALSAKHS